MDQAIGDLALNAFSYLLCVSEYTVKQSYNQSKQTVQFCIGDVTFFKKDISGKIQQLSCTAPVSHIMMAPSAMLKLDNTKMGGKAFADTSKPKGKKHCPVQALGQHVSLHSLSQHPTIIMSNVLMSQTMIYKPA